MKPSLGLLLLMSLFIAMVTSCRGDEKAETSVGIYYCPMHPEVTSEKPSVCPICHMQLVKSGGDPEGELAMMLSEITLSDSRQVLANVQTTRVRKEKRTKPIRAYGTLDYAEPNRKIISARFSGRVEKLNVNSTGIKVQKGAVLLEAYSPEVIQAENEYLLSYLSFRGNDSQSLNQSRLLQGLRQRLRLMGIDDLQELENRGEPHWRIAVRAPHTGWIVQKNINEGTYFREGDVLYEMDDLQTLWFNADFYENDIRLIRTGMSVWIRVYVFPNDTFSGRILLFNPSLDPLTRTLKARIEVANPDLRLRPQMNGEALVHLSLEPAIYVPKSAIVMTGKNNFVWIRTGANTFRPAEVVLGHRVDDDFEILSGISENMEIVVSGGFLLESESQLTGFKK